MRDIRFTLLIALTAALGCSSAKSLPPPPAWPTAGEVERITASLNETEWTQTAVPEFEIRPEYVPLVLRALTPPEAYAHPPSQVMCEVRQLRVDCRDGRSLGVRLYFSGKEPVLFTLQGVPCIRGGPYRDLSDGQDVFLPEVLTLDGVLRDAQRGDTPAVVKWMVLLDRSAGRSERPPPK